MATISSACRSTMERATGSPAVGRLRTRPGRARAGGVSSSRPRYRAWVTSSGRARPRWSGTQPFEARPRPAAVPTANGRRQAPPGRSSRRRPSLRRSRPGPDTRPPARIGPIAQHVAARAADHGHPDARHRCRPAAAPRASVTMTSFSARPMPPEGLAQAPAIARRIRASHGAGPRRWASGPDGRSAGRPASPARIRAGSRIRRKAAAAGPVPPRPPGARSSGRGPRPGACRPRRPARRPSWSCRRRRRGRRPRRRSARSAGRDELELVDSARTSRRGAQPARGSRAGRRRRGRPPWNSTTAPSPAAARVDHAADAGGRALPVAGTTCQPTSR